MILTFVNNKKGQGSQILHLDLYTENFELMTIDHHIPKSKKGSNYLSNLFPKCAKCNTKKGNKII